MIFLTGATGLLGSHILLWLLQDGRRVRALRREGSNTGMLKQVFSHYTDEADALLEKIEWYEADILDPMAMEDAFRDVETVIHSAAIVSFARQDRQRLYQVNVEGTANLVNLSIENKVGTFVYVSSVAALGRNPEGPTTEEAEWIEDTHTTHYGRSKHLAEMEVFRGKEEGLDILVINPVTILGPGEWGRGSTAIPFRLWKGIRIYGEGVNGMVDARDVAEAVNLLIREGVVNERFILSAVNISYKDLFFSINRQLGIPAPNIRLNRFIAAAAWRFEALRCFLTRSKPVITRESADKAFYKAYFDGSKITRETSLRYHPFDDTIKHTCECLIRDLGPSPKS